MFFPVLDTLTVPLNSRFNAECSTVIENISIVLQFDNINCDAAMEKLCAIAKFDLATMYLMSQLVTIRSLASFYYCEFTDFETYIIYIQIIS
jgi:hypothetical protein